jgi:hypothetical protein
VHPSALRRRVTVAEHQQVHFVRGIAHFLQLQQRSRRGRTRAVDELVLGINCCLPDFLPNAVSADLFALIALFERYFHGRVRRREAQRLGKRAVRVERLFRRLPLAKHGIESARVQELPTAALAHFKQVVSQLAVVNRFVQIAWPFQRLEHHAIQAEPFVAGVSSVVIFDAQGAGRGEANHGEQEKGSKNAECSFHDGNCSL